MNLYGFTPQEYSVIEELMKCTQDIYVTICADNLDSRNCGKQQYRSFRADKLE